MGETIQMPQPKIGLDQTTAIKCEKCGCETFTEAVMLRKVSALLTGTGQPGIIPIPTFICTRCGGINKDMLPKELQNIEEDE